VVNKETVRNTWANSILYPTQEARIILSRNRNEIGIRKIQFAAGISGKWSKRMEKAQLLPLIKLRDALLASLTVPFSSPPETGNELSRIISARRNVGRSPDN